MMLSVMHADDAMIFTRSAVCTGSMRDATLERYPELYSTKYKLGGSVKLQSSRFVTRVWSRDKRYLFLIEADAPVEGVSSAKVERLERLASWITVVQPVEPVIRIHRVPIKKKKVTREPKF